MRKIFVVCFFLMFVSALLSAQIEHINNRYMTLTLSGMFVFGGDKHGEFKNNLVAILSDDSAWKVHPQDQNLFSYWNMGDSIRIRARTSFYWFKREHKFEICNDSRQESVRAMLVHYADFSLHIVNCQSHISGYHMGFYTTTDSNGQLQYHYYPIFTYHTHLQLNDGSQWTISKKADYENEAPAYVFVDRESGTFILVTGLEREAVWNTILPGIL